MLGIVLAPYGKLPGGNYPYAITMSRGGDQTHYLGPSDPQFYSHGEAGWYYDTMLGAPKLGFFDRMKIRRYYKNLEKQAAADRVTSPFLGLGAIPTDDELASNRGYTPVESAWIATTNQGQIAPPWNPPNGWLQAGAYGPRPAPLPPGVFPYRQGSGVAGLGYLGADEATAAGAAQAAAAIQSTLQANQDRVFKLTIISTAVVAISAGLATWRTWRQLKRDEELFSKRFRRDEARIAAQEE